MDIQKQKAVCAICGQNSSLLFTAPCDYRKPHTSKPYKIYWCSACGYGEVWERPSRDEVIGFYHLDDYYTHDASQHDVSDHETNAAFLDRLRMHISWRIDKGDDLEPQEAISLLKDDSPTILEIGCGNGSNLLAFHKTGFAVAGVEPDPNARSAARASGMKILEGTAEQLPTDITSKKYDVVLMCHVLEHCLDINAAVANVKNVLKKDGVFIVETPNCESFGFRDYKAEWPWSDIPRHLNFFTPSSLKSILRKHKFDIVSEKYRGFCRQFSNSWLENEEEIWRAFSASRSASDTKPNFKLRNWKLLMKSLVSSKSSKYDSVRLIAKNNTQSPDRNVRSRRSDLLTPA